MMKIPVPKGASRRAIRHFHDEAIVYVWKWKSDGPLDPVRVYIDPISDSYTVTRQMFRFIREDGGKELEWAASMLFHGSPERRCTWSGEAVSDPTSFLIMLPEDFGIGDYLLRIIGDKKYDLSIPIIEEEEEEEEDAPMKEDQVREIVAEEIEKRLVPVHRFWNVKGGFHAYIVDPDEVQKLQRDHWREWFYMGVVFKAIEE